MKKQLKKGLSLFLSVLMVLSCWVFFAPTKAEAVNSGTYYWRVRVNSGNDTGGWDQGDWKVYGKPNNGKGSETQLSSFSQYVNFNGEKTIKSGSSTSFPTKVTFTYSFGGGMTWREMKGTAYLDVSGNNSSWTQVGSVDLGAKSSAFSAAKGTKTISGGGYPKANNVVFDLAPGAVTVPKTGTATTSMRTHLIDQYGVVVSSSATGYSKTYTLTSNRSSTTGITCAAGTTTSTYDPWTISVTNSAKLTGYDDNTITATVSYTFNGVTKDASKTFVVTDPQYTFSFDANGGTSISPSAPQTKYYYNKLVDTLIPSSGERPGYEFIAMYGDAKSPNYDFTKPTPGTTSGYTGQLTNTTPIEGDKTWYAAWWATNVTATFVDNDGKVLGTVQGKFDKTLGEVSGAAVAAIEQPEYHKRPGDTGTYTYEFYDWAVDSAVDVNRKDYTGTIGGMYLLHPEENKDSNGNVIPLILQGDVTFRPVYTIVKNSYNVKFYDVNGKEIKIYDVNGNEIEGKYAYNATPLQPGDQTLDAADNVDHNTFKYVFKGWTKVTKVPEGRTAYYLVDENGYEGENYVPITTDFTVRTDAVYVPVFEKVYKEYTISFSYDGVDNKTGYPGLHYGETYEVPVPAESYTKDGYRYTYKYWTIDGTTEVTPPATVEGDAAYKAYYEVTPAVYTINFYDYDGTLINSGKNQFDHGSSVDVGEINATQTYRDDSYEYNFNRFEAADGSTIAAGSSSIPATRDIDYYAVYDKTELMTVNYYNGDEFLESAKEVAGRTIPAYTGATPTKADDLYATNYVFAGWRDKDGNEVTTMPDGGIDLYAHYTADVTEYSVKFLKDDGTDMIPEQTLHYGDKVTVPTEEQRAKPSDNTYRYEFKAWDNDVSTVCNGDAVYTATYRKSYIYYPVTWLDENGNVFKQESYIYNERINAPLTQPETSKTPTKGENYEMVFKGWLLEGTTDTYYTRGDRITGEARYKATYEEVGMTCNVTFLDDDGTTVLQEFKVPYGTKLDDIAYTTPVKLSTEDEHYTFAGWAGTDENTTVTDKNTTYTATYTTEAHSFAIDVVKTAPTFFEEGVGTEKCSCGMVREITIPKLTDKVAPTAKLYVKDTTWVTGDTADFENAVPAAPDNNVIINTADAGDVHELFNKDGSKGAGVGIIAYSVQYGEVDPAAIADDQWVEKFNYDQTKAYLTAQAETEAGGDEAILKEKLAEVDAYMATLRANASGTLGNIKTYADGTNLENDCQFVIYGKIVDRLNNVSYINSGLLVYDTTKPEVSVSSDHHYNDKHCVEATITASDNREIESIKLNGEAIELVDGKYTVTDAGLYQVVVTDTAGNEAKKNFEVVGKHAEKTYTVAPVCYKDGREEDGYQYRKCLLCQQEIGGRILIESQGHDMDSGVYTKPTCEANGFTTYTCRKCGYQVIREDNPSTKGEHDWVLTAYADSTCSKEGYDTYTCSICSQTKTELREIDPDAHKYYYPVTVKPTCTENGSITKECKYCGYKDVTPIEKTGHTASGIWVVTQPASCLEKGLQVQYCSKCDTTEVQAQEEIPATGHSYKVKQVVPPTETEKGYTIYECQNCPEETEGHFKQGDYVDPAVSYTVTFDVEGTPTTVKKLEGETVIATEAPATAKDSDATYKYTFSHWEDAKGNTVTLPLEVKANITLKAVYDSRYVNYAVTLVRENTDGTTTQIQKIGYLHNEEVVNLPEAPEKKSTALNDYVYIGWKKQGAADATASKTWKIVASDAILVPVYEAVRREYTVVFGYDTDNVILTMTVKAGETAVYTGATPTKAYDADNHYVFSGWSDSLENILAPTYVTPKFTAVKHIKNAIHSTEADCETAGTTTFKCECGYTVTEDTTPALGHSWGVPYIDENGNSVKKCERCIKVVEDDTIYMVKFLNDDGSIIKTLGYLKYGTDISDMIPTASKEDTASVSYEFAGWTPEVKKIVTGDATYTATYNEKPKYYNVIYAIDSDNVLQIFKDVQGGSPVPAYTGKTPTKSDVDAYGHYVFDGWSRNDEIVTETLYIVAKFKKIEHTYTSAKTEADCTHGAGTTYTCSDCGYSYTVSTGKPLGHNWIVIETKEPTYEQAGYIKYQCDRCGETKEEIIPDKDYIFVNITLVDQDGAPVQGATVSLYDKGEFVTSGITDQNGKVTLVVEEAKAYTIVISGEDVDTVTADVTVNPDGSIDMSKVPTIHVEKCTCTCHRDGFWPTIFRFFHKIIKMLVGDFKCCKNPDPRYYS